MHRPCSPDIASGDCGNFSPIAGNDEYGFTQLPRALDQYHYRSLGWLSAPNLPHALEALAY
jgi:hypothetical protein